MRDETFTKAQLEKNVEAVRADNDTMGRHCNRLAAFALKQMDEKHTLIEAIGFAEAAIKDAITLEDGLDGGTGEGVLEILRRAKDGIHDPDLHAPILDREIVAARKVVEAARNDHHPYCPCKICNAIREYDRVTKEQG